MTGALGSGIEGSGRAYKRTKHAPPSPERLKLTPLSAPTSAYKAGAPALASTDGSAAGSQISQLGSSWSIRALFLQAPGLPQPWPRPTPLAHGQMPAGAPPQLAEEGTAAENEELGPLTQLAAAGGESLVSQAFCPGCGCFLSDVGCSEEERRVHVAGCQGGEPAARPECCKEEEEEEEEQQQQQQASEEGVGYLDAVGGSDDAGSDGNSEDGDEGEGWEEVAEAGEDGADGPVAAAAAAEQRQEVMCIDVSEDEGTEADRGAGGGIQAWLAERGLRKYSDCFLRAGADLLLLPLLTDEDLRQMGVATLGARKKILLGAAEQLSGGSGDDGGGGGECWEGAGAGGSTDGVEGAWDMRPAEGASVGAWSAVSGAGGAALFCSNIRRFFHPDPSKVQPPKQQQPSDTGILQYFQPKGGSIPSKNAARAAPAGAAAGGPGLGPEASYAALGAGGRSGPAPGQGRGKQAKWAHQAAQGDAPGGGGGRRFGCGGRGPAAQPVPLKPWHLVPGTPFVVDRFDRLPPGLPNRHWFLTHFHADHYKGITSKFDRGTLHCSPATGRLVQSQLRVPAARLALHPLNEPFWVEGVRITFLEANHCPGAVMILFEPPAPGTRPVLHTGDCRLVPAMQQEPVLQAVRGRCDLILDTTYCSPEYAFPTQAEVLQFSIDAVKAEAFNPKTLFLFGSYTIGKERLFLEAARVLQRKVYVSATKRKVLDCLDLPPEYASLLTTNDGETNLHAVPLWMVTHKHMTKILKHYRGRFSNVVGFQPTGWTHQRELNKTRARGRRRQKGTIITYQVPYSEHSSFTELREFVAWLQPVRIIPHVNTDNGGPKATAMVRLLRGQATA